MEAINRTITDMSNLFSQRMSEFELQLHKAPSTATNITGLATEFAAFRTFMVQALNTLQKQVELLAQSLDNMEMRGRRKILLLHGVLEAKDEETAQVVVQVIKERFQLELTASEIKRCHRMGRSTSNKPRPILFKLHDSAIRDNTWFDKTKLKGSGITVSEFLTKARHNIFMAARERFGVSQCWTREGTVFVLDADGSRHRVTSFAELNKIGQQSDEVTTQPELATVQPAAAVKGATTKTRRAAAKK